LICEAPIPWIRVVDPFKVKTTLSAFLKEAVYQVDIFGDRPAQALLAEFRATLDKKRDNKWIMKQY